MRYQLCTETECLPPRPVTAAATVEVAADGQREAGAIPAGYIEFQPGVPALAQKPGEPPAAGGGEAQSLAGFLACGLCLGLRGGLHAVRVPDDPDHDLVLPESGGRVAGRSAEAGGGVLAGHHRSVHGAGLRVDGGAGAFRGRSTGGQPVGEPGDQHDLLRVRAEPAGGVRDHAAVGPADEAQFGVEPGRDSGHCC
jgi:hypothetical protein